MEHQSFVYRYYDPTNEIDLPLIVDYGWHRGTTAYNGDNPDVVEIRTAKDGESHDFWVIMSKQERHALEEACLEHAKSLTWLIKS